MPSGMHPCPVGDPDLSQNELTRSASHERVGRDDSRCVSKRARRAFTSVFRWLFATECAGFPERAIEHLARDIVQYL